MPITPADIHNVEFAKAALGKRGYDEEQVDALLDEVSMEMINLLEANADLERRAGGAPGPVADDGAAVAELSALSAELDRARRACDRAEQRAGELQHELSRARSAPAPSPVVPAADGGRVLAMAQRTADQHRGDAEREYDAVLADARERSARMVREAHETVSGIERDTRVRREEAEVALQARHEGVVRDIAEMTQFVVDYQAALADHIARQQRHLEQAPPDRQP